MLQRVMPFAAAIPTAGEVAGTGAGQCGAVLLPVYTKIKRWTNVQPL